MDNPAKPIAVVQCTADFRSDRCPAMIQDNDHKQVDELKEYRTQSYTTQNVTI